MRLLTGKERDKARSVFLGLALDKDGVITRAECRQAQQSWFQKLNKDSQSCNVRWAQVKTKNVSLDMEYFRILKMFKLR